VLLTAYELLASAAVASRADIREFMSGNFCRCTGYEPIIDAIESVWCAPARAGVSLQDGSSPGPVAT
jgi:carbon-monoxide dehydrogenase small subunit